MKFLNLIVFFSTFLCCLNYVYAEDTTFVSVVKKIKKSVVGVGVYTPIEGNRVDLKGSGFVIGGGRYIATNYHVVSEELHLDKVQHHVVFVGEGRDYEVLKVTLVDFDPVFDLAILELADSKRKLPNEFIIGSDDFIDAGSEIAFTGFPIGSVLGLYPATHTGIVSVITPNASPATSTNQLNLGLIKQLRQRFDVYQLDATAFPGNSGSALYLKSTGEVIAIINKVLVQKGKEYALSTPSGITYAIPIKHLRNLALKNSISLN